MAIETWKILLGLGVVVIILVGFFSGFFADVAGGMNLATERSVVEGKNFGEGAGIFLGRNWLWIFILSLLIGGAIAIYLATRKNPAIVTAFPAAIGPDDQFDSLLYGGPSEIALWAIIKSFYRLAPLFGGYKLSSGQSDDAAGRFVFAKRTWGLPAIVFPSVIVLKFDPKETTRPLGRCRLREFTAFEFESIINGSTEPGKQLMMLNGFRPEDWGQRIQAAIVNGQLEPEQAELLKSTAVASQVKIQGGTV